MPLVISDPDLDRRISIAIEGKRLSELNSKPAVTEAPGFDGRKQMKESDNG